MPIRIPRDDVPASPGGLLRPALTLFVVLSIVTGLLYPLAVTGVAQTAFPHQANGSFITQGGKAVGSELIGQSFTEPGHFWGRPSATAPMPYNASASGGSNLGPTNPALAEAVKARIEALRAAFAAPSPLWLALALSLSVPQMALSAWRWQLTAASLDAPLPFRHAFAEYYLGSFLNQVLPGGMLGDANLDEPTRHTSVCAAALTALEFVAR